MTCTNEKFIMHRRNHWTIIRVVKMLIPVTLVTEVVEFTNYEEKLAFYFTNIFLTDLKKG